MEDCRKYPQRAATVIAEFRQAVSQTNGKTLITEAAKKQHVETLREESQRRLADIRSQGEKARTNLLTYADTKLRTVTGSEMAQVAAELQKTRVWDRLSKQLDAHRSIGQNPAEIVSTFVRTAAAKQDMNALEVLQDELPAYLQINHLEGYAPQATIEINAAFREIADPIRQQAYADREALQDGWKYIEMALAYADDAMLISRDGAPPVPITADVPAVNFTGELITYEGVSAMTPELNSIGKSEPTLALPLLSNQY